MRLVKSANFLFSIVKMKLTGHYLPLTVIFNLTNRCNTKCRHCYAGYFSRDTSRELSTQEVKRLIQDLKDNGCLRISFSGGEPLLREDIPELIDYAQALGLSVTLNSNGILVPKYLTVLKKLDSLAISLDGRPEHHDILRGKGTGEKALFAARQATEHGLKVHVNMVLNKHNLGDIDYMLDLAREHGFKVEFNLLISYIFENGVPADEFKPTDEQIRNALRYIIQKKKESAPILFSAAAYESVLGLWKDFSVEQVMEDSSFHKLAWCPAAKLFCLIDSDGTLWACPHLIGKVAAKNALEVGVAEAWKAAKNHPCRGCYQVYHHEFSLLMNLDPRVIRNYFKSVTVKK